MVTAKEVLDYLRMLAQWQTGEETPWLPLLESAAQQINRLTKTEPAADDDRLVRAAAGWAAYQIALCGAQEVTGFTAGDFSVSAKDAGGALGARQRMEQFFSEAAELLRDQSFVFQEV